VIALKYALLISQCPKQRPLIHRVNWCHRVYDLDTIAILWV